MRMFLALLAMLGTVQGKDAEIPARMREMMAANEVPGAVTAVATRRGVRSMSVTGFADAAHTRKLRKDSIFWIASMTKPLTAVAVLMLQDEGKLSIDDPVAKYIPALAPLGPLTLKHLLTHTSGMGEATPAEEAAARTLAEIIPAYASKPVGFAPGTRWRYCQSGINTLGRVVEVVSGMPLPEFFAQRITGPLGMKDTTFYPTAAQMPRVVTPAKQEQGKLVDTGITLLHGKSPTDTNRFPAANGGLYSTAPDYAKFARMLLNGGTLQGRRYLSPAALRLMTTSHTGDLKAGFLPGHGWGLGVGVLQEPQGVTAMLAPGTFGHGGAYGTQAWVDPKNGVALILMIQRAGFKNGDDSPVRLAFQTAAMGQ